MGGRKEGKGVLKKEEQKGVFRKLASKIEFHYSNKSAMIFYANL